MPFSVPAVFGAGAYIWSGPPGAMIDSMPLPVTVIGAGGNQVNITLGNTGGQVCVQAANSCNATAPCSASMTVEILDDSYRPTIEADTVQHLTCSGAPAMLEVQVLASVGFSYVWLTDSTGNIVSGANLIRPTVDRTGRYNLVVTNAQNGCSSSVDIRVAEPDTPRITDMRLRHITCYGFEDGEINVAAVEGGRTPHLFSLDGAPFVYAPTFRYLTPGLHALEIESADGCRADTVFEVIQPNEFLLDLGADTSIHLGQSLPLMSLNWLNEPDRAAQVLVKPAELLGNVCDTCRHFPINSFHYTITVVDSAGCIAVDDRTVAVSKERYVYVPNVFKPDGGDTGNELLQIFGGEDVSRIKLFRVANRWGKIVHQQEDFLPNDGLAAWDGKIDGQPANPAVFVWEAEILFKDGLSEWRNGTVTVVR
jgi:hypothetical protein